MATSRVDRGYTLIEVPVVARLWPDDDLIVRVMEYVRLNLRSLVPELPAECQVDLIAAGTAHNIDLRPILGLYAPPHILEFVPDWLRLYETVENWCNAMSDRALRDLGRATDAPSWIELKALGVFPRRSPPA